MPQNPRCAINDSDESLPGVTTLLNYPFFPSIRREGDLRAY
jgi:hypothetical protein